MSFLCQYLPLELRLTFLVLNALLTQCRSASPPLLHRSIRHRRNVSLQRPSGDPGNHQHILTFTVNNSYGTYQSQCIPEPGATCRTYEAEGTAPSGPILFPSLLGYEFSMQGFQASDCTGQAVGVKAADFQ